MDVPRLLTHLPTHPAPPEIDPELGLTCRWQRAR
jgi:hypothetical protein